MMMMVVVVMVKRVSCLKQKRQLDRRFSSRSVQMPSPNVDVTQNDKLHKM